MISTLKTGPVPTDAALSQKPEPTRDPEAAPAQPTRAAAPAKAPPAAPPNSDLRLVIERDKDNAFYVYRLVDRSTGKVVVELPRDQVSDLATDPAYEAGAVVSTKA